MTTTADLTHRGMSNSHAPNTLPLEDRFEILKDIGDGSFGTVVLARIRTAGANIARRGSVVAIKTMKKTFDSFAPCLELREVVFLKTLPVHSHLVPALDIFLDPFTKKLHICMEYMEGNLYQLMKSRDHKCLDNATVKSILYQIMLGLEHIHAHNFFHRDIKPENILVSTSTSDMSSLRRYSSLVATPSSHPTYAVKIADFGLARETHSKLPYTTYVSTRWYRAPEVLLRAGEYSAPVDIWAVGAMAVEVATLKPLFPGGNEVDQVWRVCEIMGSPGNWYNKAGARVGGGEWKEGIRLANKLGFSFPKMAPHAMETILQAPQWPASLSHFVTWCLMWDPKTRPTSTQAIAHDYFVDAVDPLRPRSSASRILGRKQSDISHRGSKDVGSMLAGHTSNPALTSKPSWFRKSLIGRSESNPDHSAVSHSSPGKDAPRPSPVSVVVGGPAVSEVPAAAAKKAANAAKRATWANGSTAPINILPSIKPISPISDAVNAQANKDERNKKIARQLSVNSSTNNYNDKNSVTSPVSGQKESFFSHLRKRARRLSGRHMTPASPSYDDIEAQAGCSPWAVNSNRNSMIIDSAIAPKPDNYDGAAKPSHPAHAHPVPYHAAPPPPAHQNASNLKRHHSLPKAQQPKSVDNLLGAARNTGSLGSRTTRRSKIVAPGGRQYDTPDEEDELLDEVLSSTQNVMQHMDKDSNAHTSSKPLRQSASTMAISNPYPTPSPSASGNIALFADQTSLAPKPLDIKKPLDTQLKWPTPPYEESEWAASASASIWAASNRF
ncbi:Meiosis induction protein kinase IME2/SME1 [Ceratocystis fimbriata CBS 114723]|uniref:Meiosis induction protein kinase IME2/SME1 n=1 Tax=Ceratocystis fimbriata CBS 114723 TaxID=1035309 RepID=A0A2C5XHH1_9PEZI|nr:Meiosis induction protein kinase IME2/SME1 [Ceratocystis fimbriata CBS 114723]